MEHLPSSESDVRELAAVVGLYPASLTRLPGGTNAVWLLEDERLVLRVAGPDVPLGELQRHVLTASLLEAAGVPFVRPAADVLDSGRVTGTLWVWEAPRGEVCYHSFGKATRFLHTAGTVALSSPSAPALTDALDAQVLAEELSALAVSGLLSPAEHALLGRWPERMMVELGALPVAPRVVVHDDLWVKNVIPSRAGAVLSDPDGLSWGCPEYDLAFVRRGLETGAVSAAEAEAFAAGYGAPLPSLDVSWTLARFHRLRWVFLLLRRRPWLPAAGTVLAGELPLWGRPDGPRPL